MIDMATVTREDVAAWRRALDERGEHDLQVRSWVFCGFGRWPTVRVALLDVMPNAVKVKIDRFGQPEDIAFDMTPTEAEALAGHLIAAAKHARDAEAREERRMQDKIDSGREYESERIAAEADDATKESDDDE